MAPRLVGRGARDSDLALLLRRTPRILGRRRLRLFALLLKVGLLGAEPLSSRRLGRRDRDRHGPLASRLHKSANAVAQIFERALHKCEVRLPVRRLVNKCLVAILELVGLTQQRRAVVGIDASLLLAAGAHVATNILGRVSQDAESRPERAALCCGRGHRVAAEMRAPQTR